MSETEKRYSLKYKNVINNNGSDPTSNLCIMILPVICQKIENIDFENDETFAMRTDRNVRKVFEAFECDCSKTQTDGGRKFFGVQSRWTGTSIDSNVSRQSIADTVFSVAKNLNASRDIDIGHLVLNCLPVLKTTKKRLSRSQRKFFKVIVVGTLADIVQTQTLSILCKLGDKQKTLILPTAHEINPEKKFTYDVVAQVNVDQFKNLQLKKCTDIKEILLGSNRITYDLDKPCDVCCTNEQSAFVDGIGIKKFIGNLVTCFDCGGSCASNGLIYDKENLFLLLKTVSKVNANAIIDLYRR